jgi:peptidoglycan/LPS O-acetylase OafA/YrhL
MRSPGARRLTETSKNREYSLDALRGVAAMMVVIAHTTIAGLYNVEPLWGYLKWTPLRLLWSGHQAVVLFFVLSGFALVRMWQAIRSNRYDAYFVARVTRLFPPYICSVLLALVVYNLVAGFIEWDKGWMNIPKPSFIYSSILDHVLMVGWFNTSEINPPIWSIIHEMRISLVFPLIYMLVSRFSWRAVAGFYLMSAVIGWALLGNVPLSPIQTHFLLTLHYSSFFALGAVIALHQKSLCRFFTKIEGRRRSALWVTAAMVYAYSFDNSWSIGSRAFGDMVTGVGAAVIVCLALSDTSTLLVRCGSYLGKISYSLYLNHVLVLNLSVLFFYQAYGSLMVWAVTIVGALILSALMYKFIEVPSISISRYLRRRMLLQQPVQIS